MTVAFAFAAKFSAVCEICFPNATEVDFTEDTTSEMLSRSVAPARDNPGLFCTIVFTLLATESLTRFAKFFTLAKLKDMGFTKSDPELRHSAPNIHGVFAANRSLKYLRKPEFHTDIQIAFIFIRRFFLVLGRFLSVLRIM